MASPRGTRLVSRTHPGNATTIRQQRTAISEREVLEIILLLIGAVIGVVLTLVCTAYLQRPKLRLMGTSIGSDCSAGIQNQPGLLGFTLKPVILFDKAIVGEERPVGYPIMRIPALGCHAHLVDRVSDKTVTVLFWRNVRTGEVLRDQHLDIHNGQEYGLMVFVTDPTDPSKYYPWELDQSTTAQPNSPRVPHPICFDEPRKFTVRIRSSTASTLLRFSAEVERDFNGQLRYLIRPK